MKPVLHTIRTGSSGTGYSYYNSFLSCPRRSNLDSLARQNDSETSSTNKATTIGVIFHAYMELYYGHKLNPNVAVRFQNDFDEAELIEAERLFKAYTAQYARNELGRVVGVEVDASGPDAEAAIGISPYTARLDMVVKLTAKDVKQVEKSAINPGHLEPGYWIVDHKTGGQKASNLLDKRLASMQFTSYELAWNAAHPKQKVKGVISNEVIRTKTPQLFRIIVPAASETQIAATRTMYRTAAKIMSDPELSDAAVPTDNNCFGYGKVCQYYLDGQCARGVG